MKRSLCLLAIGALGFLASEVFSAAAELPFYILNPERAWKVQTVQKNLSKALICELLITHPGAMDRMYVLSHQVASPEGESLATFAEQIKHSFRGFQLNDTGRQATTEFGFSGVESKFELLKDDQNWDCVLFVFDLPPVQWGVLYCRPKLSAGSVGVAFSLLQRKTPGAPEVIGMKPYRVHDAALSDFPISFKVHRGQGSDRVQAIVITEVARDSVLEKEGVKPGDAIVEIDGRKATDFSAQVGKDSELGRVFLNRNSGDEVELAIVSAQSNKLIHVKLRASNFLNRMLRR